MYKSLAAFISFMTEDLQTTIVICMYMNKHVYFEYTHTFKYIEYLLKYDSILEVQHKIWGEVAMKTKREGGGAGGINPGVSTPL